MLWQRMKCGDNPSLYFPRISPAAAFLVSCELPFNALVALRFTMAHLFDCWFYVELSTKDANATLERYAAIPFAPSVGHARNRNLYSVPSSRLAISSTRFCSSVSSPTIDRFAFRFAI